MSARAPRLWPWILLPVVAATAVVTFAIVGGLTGGAAWPSPWWGFFPWFPVVGIWIFFGFLFLFGWGGGPWGWNDREDRDESRGILRERYVRGEITREQFDEMRRRLDEHQMHNAYEGDSAQRAGP